MNENPVFWEYTCGTPEVERDFCVIYALAGVEQYLLYKETYFYPTRLSRVDTLLTEELDDAREFFADIEGAVADFFGEDLE